MLLMKQNLQLFILLLVVCLSANTQGTAQTISEWRSASSGLVSNASGLVWEKLVTGVWTLQAAAAKPSGSSNVTIRTGHTVTIDATLGILNLTIESGATLNCSSTSPATLALRPGTSSAADITAGFINNVVTITNNGTLGSTTGSNDGIALEIPLNCKTLTLTGSGTTKIARFRPVQNNTNSPVTFTVDQNMDLLINNNYAFTATQNSGTNAATENVIININAGKTVKLYAGGTFHGSVSTSPQANPSGTYTYNISGILDLSATGTPSSGGLQTSTAGTPILNLNIKNGGVMKLGSSFAAYRGGNNGSINMIIENGGIVDATATTSGITNNSTLNTGYTWFVTLGTGTVQQIVGSSGVTYPVGPNLTSYDPMTLTNGGGKVFSGAVAPVNSPAGLPNTSKAVNRTWGVVPSTLPATVDISFGYNTGEGNASCVLTDPMQLYSNNTAVWAALTTATPTIVPLGGATTYQAGYTSVSVFPFFALVNAPAIPVEMTIFKGYTKGAVNMLEWSTATERNNREFIVERSLNAVDFQSIGSVKGNGNSDIVRNYTFADESAPLSIAYYRLRQIDNDGRETPTKIITLSCSGAAKVGLNKVYPSVTNSTLTIEMMTDGKSSLTVTDILGRTVHTKDLGENMGAVIQTLNVSSLTNGVYFITLESNGIRMTEKFEKN